MPGCCLSDAATASVIGAAAAAPAAAVSWTAVLLASWAIVLVQYCSKLPWSSWSHSGKWTGRASGLQGHAAPIRNTQHQQTGSACQHPAWSWRTGAPLQGLTQPRRTNSLNPSLKETPPSTACLPGHNRHHPPELCELCVQHCLQLLPHCPAACWCEVQPILEQGCLPA
jgi:hypothetical protein